MGTATRNPSVPAIDMSPELSKQTQQHMPVVSSCDTRAKTNKTKVRRLLTMRLPTDM